MLKPGQALKELGRVVDEFAATSGLTMSQQVMVAILGKLVELSLLNDERISDLEKKAGKL